MFIHFIRAFIYSFVYELAAGSGTNQNSVFVSCSGSAHGQRPGAVWYHSQHHEGPLEDRSRGFWVHDPVCPAYWGRPRRREGGEEWEEVLMLISFCLIVLYIKTTSKTVLRLKVSVQLNNDTTSDPTQTAEKLKSAFMFCFCHSPSVLHVELILFIFYDETSWATATASQGSAVNSTTNLEQPSSFPTVQDSKQTTVREKQIRYPESSTASVWKAKMTSQTWGRASTWRKTSKSNCR